MAYRAPSFYFFNLGREVGISNILIEPAVTQLAHPTFDGRQGELFQFEDSFGANATKRLEYALDTSVPEHHLIDTVIISGHNMNGNDLQIVSRVPGTEIVYGPTEVVEANGELILAEFTPGTPDRDELAVEFIQGSGSSLNITEYTEVFASIKRTPGGANPVRGGPEFNWNHSWERTQRDFLNDAGVSSTLLLGAARKTWNLTWRNMTGTDRQIFLDMREQTSDWAHPFWFLPPDDAFPIQFVKMNANPQFIQDFINPGLAGVSDSITLPMIQVIG